MNENQNFPPQRDESGGARVRQSGLGIASFVLSVLSAFGMMSVFVMLANKITPYVDPATGALNVTEEQLQQELMPAVGGLVLLFPLAMLLTVIAIILGIVALTQRDRKKAFGIAGLIIGGLQVLFFVFALVIGISAAG
jgi:hypothetical protein